MPEASRDKSLGMFGLKMTRLLQILVAFGLSGVLTLFGILYLILQVEPHRESMLAWFPLGIFSEFVGIPYIVAALFQYPILAGIFSLALTKVSVGRAIAIALASYLMLLAGGYYIYHKENQPNHAIHRTPAVRHV